jgi:hypothetical protein
MAYTLAQLQVLENAIATGSKEVVYGDKKVTYNSLDDMLRVKRMMEAQLYPGNIPVRRKYADYDKGIKNQEIDNLNEYPG